MDIDQLRELTVLVDTNSYSIAAEQLFISQSSLSKHIKALEDELGRPLFERTARKSVLTPFGREFLKYAAQIVEIQDKYITELLSNPVEKDNTLTIGIVSGVFEYFFNGLVQPFTKEYPQYDIKLIAGELPEIRKSLSKKESDVIILLDYPDDPSSIFCGHLLEKDPLMLVVPADHPIAGHASASINEVANEEFIMLKEGCVPRNLSEKCCLDAGFTPNIVFESSSVENIMFMVEQHKGIGMIAAKHPPQITSDVRLVALEEDVYAALKIYYRKDNFSSGVELFINKALEIYDS